MDADNAATAALTELTPQTARGRATREAILRAAEQVFGASSYDRASISEITRTAGVAQGTFYLYFPDKRSAFVELVHQLNHDLRRAIREATKGLDDRLAIERTGFETFFDFTARHEALYRIVRESEFVAPETHKWHYATLARGYIAGLERAQGAGQITSGISAETIAWILMGIAELIGGRWVLQEHRPPPDDVMEEIMAFIGHALREAKTNE